MDLYGSNHLAECLYICLCPYKLFYCHFCNWCCSPRVPAKINVPSACLYFASGKANASIFFDITHWNHPNIKIKETHKGKAVIFLCKKRYRRIIYKQLQKQNSYKNVDNDLSLKIMKKSRKLLKNHKTITEKAFNYVSVVD